MLGKKVLVLLRYGQAYEDGREDGEDVRLNQRDQRLEQHFDIEHGGESNRQLIAWPDAYGRSKFARPKRRRDTLLDVQAGQEILHSSERGEQELVVSQVRLYRTNRPRENGQVVLCGRSWLEEPS